MKESECDEIKANEGGIYINFTHISRLCKDLRWKKVILGFLFYFQSQGEKKS